MELLKVHRRADGLDHVLHRIHELWPDAVPRDEGALVPPVLVGVEVVGWCGVDGPHGGALAVAQRQPGGAGAQEAALQRGHGGRELFVEKQLVLWCRRVAALGSFLLLS